MEFISTIFGMVFIVTLVRVIIFKFFKKNEEKFKKSSKICLISFAIVLLFSFFTEDTSTKNSQSNQSETNQTVASNNESEEKAKKESEELEERLEQEKLEKLEKEQAFQQDKTNYRTDITYDNLARTPDNYKEEYVTLSGKVLQVSESDGIVQLRVAINDDYDQVVMLLLTSDILSERLLDDDHITFYGKSSGLYTYKSVMNVDITVPLLAAFIVERT